MVCIKYILTSKVSTICFPSFKFPTFFLLFSHQNLWLWYKLRILISIQMCLPYKCDWRDQWIWYERNFESAYRQKCVQAVSKLSSDLSYWLFGKTYFRFHSVNVYIAPTTTLMMMHCFFHWCTCLWFFLLFLLYLFCNVSALLTGTHTRMPSFRKELSFQIFIHVVSIAHTHFVNLSLLFRWSCERALR